MDSFRAALWASAAFVSLLAAGCQDATQVTIDLRTDALCSGDPEAEDVFDSAAFYITSGDGLDDPVVGPFPDATTQPGQCSGGDPLSEIGTLGLIPGASGATASVGLRVLVGINGKTGQACADAGCGDTECIDIRRRVSFVPNQSLLLPITASRNCLGLCCDDGETCVDGACVGVEQPPCNPELEVCGPVPPEPPLGQLWAFAIPNPDGLHIDASRARVTVDGTLVVSVAGHYPGTMPSSNIEFAGRQLVVGYATGVFIARIEIPTSGAPTVTAVASCGGDDVSVRDLDYGDQGPSALLMARGPLLCGDGNSSPIALGEVPVPLLWTLTPNTDEAVANPLRPAQGVGAPPDAQSLAFERVGSIDVTATHLAGTHQGGDATVTFGAEVAAIPSHDSPFFYELAFSSNPASATEVWLRGTEAGMEFDFTETHQLVQGGGAVWNIGSFEGAHLPLGDAVVDGGRTVFATPNGQVGPALAASGGIAIVNRARFTRGGTDVLVPVRLDADLSPRLKYGDEDETIEGASAAVIRFSPGGVGENATTTVPLKGKDGRHPFAAGFGNSACLVYDHDGQGVVRCLKQPPLRFGSEVEMMGFDAARASTETVGWLVMMGQTTGDLGGGFPSFGNANEGPNLFFAGFRTE